MNSHISLPVMNQCSWIYHITFLSFLQRWQWNVGTVAIFLAWINLVLFAQKFPRFGIYVVMFKDILRTFFQFFLVFMLFIIAFALAFYCLLQNQVSNVGSFHAHKVIWFCIFKDIWICGFHSNIRN